jgi:hypothetical protein
LKHPWIVNARRSDSVVPKKPTEYDEAVKSVQQWNEALKSSSAGSLRRTCRPISLSPVPRRCEQPPILATPARRPLNNFAKPRYITEHFRSPDHTENDNWDADFVSSISPSALQLPHLRPQDNFGGLLSSEKLKAFASFETVTEETNWDDNFEGHLTAKNPPHPVEYDLLQTIRPYHHKNLITNQIRAVASAKPPDDNKPSRATPPFSPILKHSQNQILATKRAASTKPGSQITSEVSPNLTVSLGSAPSSMPTLMKV